MKYQWNKVEWLLTYSELKAALLDNLYSEVIGYGFLVDEETKDHKISGRYVIKNTIKDLMTTPSGDLEEVERITYSTFEFIIEINKNLSLILRNPPSSALKLGSALGRITKNRIVFHSKKIDLEIWIEDIKSQLSDFTLKRIDIIQVPFSTGVSASMTLRGKGELIKSFKTSVVAGKSIITRADFSFRSEYGIKQSSINNRCFSTSQDKQTAELLYPILYNSLNKIIV